MLFQHKNRFLEREDFGALGVGKGSGEAWERLGKGLRGAVVL